ncbi:coiled-coil domain-containing protein mad1 [Coemansia sp. S16]|nr:coiled-coil domain-containing protein mad1 [Coemansia sp. S680]KAJ2033420.1 coiled-coil domain-containing protein mad1 [Coemansia sp. S3946]KAJ2046437.1 coiled-coil domain-containing protein mad1 [Coemansia sp. S16]
MNPFDSTGVARTQPRGFMRQASTGTLVVAPPSTVIRSRFLALGEPRGTKRIHSPPGQWAMETPSHAPASRRLFAQSPARDTMDAERARFELHQVELERERDREAALRTRLDLEAQLAEAVRRAEKLDRDRRWLADQDARREDAQRALDEDVARRRDEMQAECDALREKCRVLEDAADATARKMRAMMAEHRKEVDQLRDQLRRALEPPPVQPPPPAVAEVARPVPAEPPADRVAQLERDVAEQCAYIRAADAQNRALRADVKRLTAHSLQSDAYHEAAQSLQAKVLRLEAQLAETADRDAQLQQLLEEREQWARVFDQPPLATAKCVDAQRRLVAELESRASERELTLEDVLKRRADAEKQFVAARDEAVAGKAELLETRAQLQRAQCEAEFLRAQLASYDAEDARLMPTYDAPKAERIRQLELFIDRQRKSLGAELPDVAPLLASYRRDAEAAKEELAKAAVRCDALERDVARMELQLGAGLGYNPQTTRILQLRENPAAMDYAIRSERLAALEAENAALVDRLRTAVMADDEEAPLFCTIDNLRKEKESLTQQLKDSGKLISRYKKEWKRKAAQLREVVYTVLGFRVDFLSTGSVRFTSTYAENLDHTFIYSHDPNDPTRMLLVGGASKPYLKGLANDIRYWVQEKGSIPVFMASVTQSNFEAQPEGHKPEPLPPTED